MKHLLYSSFILLTSAFIPGCSDAEMNELLGVAPPAPAALPAAKRDPVEAAHAMPDEFRQKNWGPSCMWASMATALERCGRTDLADKARKHGGRASMDALTGFCRQNHIPYRSSTNRDMSVLRWCAATGHYAVVEDQTNHARDFVGMSARKVYVINCNDTSQVFSYDRQAWTNRVDRNGVGWRGWCIAPDLPVAPAPTRS